MEVKKALEELNMYKKSRKRMAYIKERIAELQDRIYSLGGGGENLGIQGGQVTKEDKVIALMDQIKKFRDELISAEIYSLCFQNDIERKIYKLREPYCSVLRGYYVEEKNLIKLAYEMNYSFDGIKQAKHRGIKLYAELPYIYNKAPR